MYIHEGDSKNLVNLVTFVVLKMCCMWIRHDIRIVFVFLKTDCKKSDLSSQNIIFYDYLPMEISGKFPENFRKI